MTYQPRIGKPAQVQFNRLPDRGLTAVRELMAMVCEDPHNPTWSDPADVPGQRWAELGEGAGFVQFEVDDAARTVMIVHLTWVG